MEIKLEQFNGPLDLLLSLVEDKEMSINEIVLGKVTEQYLAYLEEVERIAPEDLADFLVIATKLLLMKSRALLPQLMPVEEDEVGLADQLRLYQKFVAVSKKIESAWLQPRVAFVRHEPMRVVENPELPENVTTDTLRNSMGRLIDRLKPPKPLPKTHIDKTVSVKERIQQIRDYLQKNKTFSFKQALGEKPNRTETIISFLALLELVKQRTVLLHQDGLHSDIMIKKA